MVPLPHFPVLPPSLLTIFFFLIAAALASPVANPDPLNPLTNLLSIVEGITNAPPPKIAWTPTPSLQCAGVNGGELQCCRAMVAGDLQLVVLLAAEAGYQLNPNDINGLDCEQLLTTPFA
jgi:hypothetical protein